MVSLGDRNRSRSPQLEFLQRERVMGQDERWPGVKPVKLHSDVSETLWNWVYDEIIWWISWATILQGACMCGCAHYPGQDPGQTGSFCGQSGCWTSCQQRWCLWGRKPAWSWCDSWWEQNPYSWAGGGKRRPVWRKATLCSSAPGQTRRKQVGKYRIEGFLDTCTTSTHSGLWRWHIYWSNWNISAL